MPVVNHKDICLVGITEFATSGQNIIQEHHPRISIVFYFQHIMISNVNIVHNVELD